MNDKIKGKKQSQTAEPKVMESALVVFENAKKGILKSDLKPKKTNNGSN